MPDTRLYLVKNTERKKAILPSDRKRAQAKDTADHIEPVVATGPVYDYWTKGGKPVAFDRETALHLAGGDEDKICVVPDDMEVVLGPGARKLPQSKTNSSQVDVVTEISA